MNLRSRLLIPLAALVFLACVGANAQAAILCVNKPPCLTGTSYAMEELQAALADAGASKEPDTILIGPAATTYQGPYSYTSESPLRIVGSGARETVLASALLAGPVLDLPVPDVEVSNLGIEVRSESGLRGLSLRGRASEVSVRQVGDGGGIPVGVEMLKEGVFENGSVTMLKGHAVDAEGPGARTVADSYIASGSTPIEVSGALNVVRSEIHGVGGGVYALGDEATMLLDSDLITTLGNGVEASNGADVEARSLTIVKTHADGQTAIGAYSSIVGHETSVELTNSILSGFQVPFRRSGKLDAPAALRVSYTAWTGVPEDGVGGGEIELGPGNLADTEADFANPDPIDPLTSPDYRLRLGSPLIDVGDPALSGRDLDGKERPLDGDGDGGALPDLGAYEHGPLFIREPVVAPPAPPAAPGQPATAPRAGIAKALIGRGGLAAPDRRGRVGVKLACAAEGPCAGAVKLLRGRARLGTAPFSLAAGTTRVVKLQLALSVREQLAAAPAARLRVEVRSRQSDGGVAVRKVRTTLRTG